MGKYSDYAADTYAKPGYAMDTQIVVNDAHPQGERIFILANGDIVARVPLTPGTSYGIVCNAMLDAFTAAGCQVWDRDEQMSFKQAVTGRA